MEPGWRRSSVTIADIDESKHEELEEEDELMTINERLNLRKSRFVIFPDSTFRGFWDMVSFAMILYQGIVLPLKLSFEIDYP